MGPTSGRHPLSRLAFSRKIATLASTQLADNSPDFPSSPPNLRGFHPVSAARSRITLCTGWLDRAPSALGIEERSADHRSCLRWKNRVIGQRPCAVLVWHNGYRSASRLRLGAENHPPATADKPRSGGFGGIDLFVHRAAAKHAEQTLLGHPVRDIRQPGSQLAAIQQAHWSIVSQSWRTNCTTPANGSSRCPAPTASCFITIWLISLLLPSSNVISSQHYPISRFVIRCQPDQHDAIHLARATIADPTFQLAHLHHSFRQVQFRDSGIRTLRRKSTMAGR